MADGVAIGREGMALVISLDRPQAINALSRQMIDAISAALHSAVNDDAVRLVLFEGRGPRGFCAGGDVRSIRDMVLSGRLDEADAYFEAEYGMNALIAAYPKPTAVIAHGATMGGGIGIAGHCRHRFALETARFAMPEAAIGFVADVGVNALLAGRPVAPVLAFLLSGIAVGPADAMALGLADHVISAGSSALLRQGIVDAAAAADPEAAIAALAARLAVDPGPARFMALAGALHSLDIDDTTALVTRLLAHPDPDWQALIAPLALRSPTSLEAIRLSQLAARRHPGITHALGVDLALARVLVRLPDFAEGVRAVLVDKDQTPRWSPSEQVRVSPKSFINSIAAVSSFDTPSP
jgi:enoyl-CoA hydratase